MRPRQLVERAARAGQIADREREPRNEADTRGRTRLDRVLRRAVGDLARPGGPLSELARTHDATPGQLAIAWLLARSPVMLPIPGTASVEHLEENVAAGELELASQELELLAGAV